jgi:hypothetical protein
MALTTMKKECEYGSEDSGDFGANDRVTENKVEP